MCSCGKKQRIDPHTVKPSGGSERIARGLCKGAACLDASVYWFAEQLDILAYFDIISMIPLNWRE